jgi:hypothetical protein
MREWRSSGITNWTIIPTTSCNWGSTTIRIRYAAGGDGI